MTCFVTFTAPDGSEVDVNIDSITTVAEDKEEHPGCCFLKGPNQVVRGNLLCIRGRLKDRK